MMPPSRTIITKQAALAVLFLSILAAATATAQSTPPAANLQGDERQKQADDYTRYELLAPETAAFRIVYEVTATTPGTRFFFNVIRKGSEASDESVFDMMTGAALKFEVVSGAEARAAGFAEAELDTSYIKIHLPRPVPATGEIRLRIDKTYKDVKSYYREGNLIVFARSLGIKRNAVVLPAGYEIVSLNVPSQILPEADGRITISFMNGAPVAMPLVIKVRPLRQAAKSIGQPPKSLPSPPATLASAAPAAPIATVRPSQASRLSERAHQDREIVYFLEPPETHAFSLYHDYTESRENMDRYLNVVRQGSTVSKPGARILDTGEELKWEIVKGDAITRAKIDIGETVRPDTEVVVVRFPPVKKGQSVRLRIEETYSDAGRYRLEGDDLVFDRSFGRPRNAVVLPAGWFLTASSMPAVVAELSDGRIRLDYVNSRPDEIDVLLKARRRP